MLRKNKSLLALLFVFLFSGCSSVDQKLDPNVFYKRDTIVEVNGQSYEGVVTIPAASSYSIVIKPRGGIDLLLVKSCHREESYEKISSGWFGKNSFRYNYSPIRGIEDTRVCPLSIESFDSGDGKHSWAFMDFTNPAYRIQATLSCNGKVMPVDGVGVCQAKHGLVQRIKFNEPIRFAPAKPENCSAPVKRVDGYEITLSLGMCEYHFDTKDGRLGRLTTVGYDGVLVRSSQ